MEEELFKEEPNLKKLENLVKGEIPESVKLEYKSATTLDEAQKDDKKKVDIAKEVCALANSEGGWFILGIKEGEGTEAKGFDSVDIDLQEWLENILAGHLDPKVHGLNVHPIYVEDAGGYVHVIEISESLTAPHMVEQEKRYYQRHSTQSLPMDEHLVRALYFKTNTSHLEAEPDLRVKYPKKKNPGAHVHNITQLDFRLIITIKNIGRVREDVYKVQVILPLELNDGGRKQDIRWQKVPHNMGSGYIGVVAQNDNYLFPNEPTSFDLPLKSLYPKNDGMIKELLDQKIYVLLYYSGGVLERCVSIGDAVQNAVKGDFKGLPHPIPTQ